MMVRCQRTTSQASPSATPTTPARYCVNGTTCIHQHLPACQNIYGRLCFLPPTTCAVIEELRKRGIPIDLRTTQEFISKAYALDRHTLVVGDFSWTRSALEQLNIVMPEPPDYPSCLQKFLHRRVWQSTLGEVGQQLANDLLQTHNGGDPPPNIFIKPATDTKAFSAIIEPKDQMLDALLTGIEGILKPLPRETPVHCAEIVDMILEYRVYVVSGDIRAVCQYKGPPTPPVEGSESFSANSVGCNVNDVVASNDDGAPSSAKTTGDGRGGVATLDMRVVREAVQLLSDSPEGRMLTGYGMDFAVIASKNPNRFDTCLVEVNDGYSLGAYPGLSGRDYTDLLCSRWHALVSAAPFDDDSKACQDST
eukprot:INCI19095.3.p1 GENE.INCI19095.3~~INCI19095.3.p1  ORF type:complete len:365 (+),score=66.50 INCI19095.3:279-1373(+)